MLTIREQLQMMDSIRMKNDEAFAEAARRQKREVWRTWGETLTCVACGVLAGLIVLLIAG